MRALVQVFGLTALVAGTGAIGLDTKPPEPSKPVCKTERSIGSRVAKQRCKTQAELDREAAEARRKLDMGNRNPAPPAVFKAPDPGR